MVTSAMSSRRVVVRSLDISPVTEYPCDDVLFVSPWWSRFRGCCMHTFLVLYLKCYRCMSWAPGLPFMRVLLCRALFAVRAKGSGLSVREYQVTWLIENVISTPRL